MADIDKLICCIFVNSYYQYFIDNGYNIIILVLYFTVISVTFYNYTSPKFDKKNLYNLKKNQTKKKTIYFKLNSFISLYIKVTITLSLNITTSIKYTKNIEKLLFSFSVKQTLHCYDSYNKAKCKILVSSKPTQILYYINILIIQ